MHSSTHFEKIVKPKRDTDTDLTAERAGRKTRKHRKEAREAKRYGGEERSQEDS